ncbi:MAG: hypothetical protein EAZ32_02950 [Cytophagia bacterium]|nr:MAG: hypothetical protein EAZ46_02030 [Runella sp.]TAG22416.1 MAG: hypothetical protein EAZ38_05765 [Cytophagales bacterium]TAG41446.1 MAG: hypothetical protein EAZ32_02950 [Cytophagia bacterium]TAG51478.1 MAG: hypothetical protein EAZ29_09490 [Runella slithyformis]TAG83284.1 MAG: hypothetical protein EAZ22_03340 [Cytophagales bacterium]
MKTLLLLVLYLLAGHFVFGQNQYVLTHLFDADAPKINLTKPITSAAFRFKEQPNWANLRLIADGDTLALHPDPHAEIPQSQLVIFRQSVGSLELLGAKTTTTLTGVYAKPIILPTYYRQFRVAVDCEKPPVVPASVWRAGLTPPKELPTATAVKFIIVHHEAGSNTPSNFTNVVRNIYVFHTQTNGWNDVGYNFLVAQDGTVFEGRDGQGRLDGDNVQGAHFCGFNAGTMGICLLGDYMTAQPPAPALASLTKLVAWKMKKENLVEPGSRSLHASSGKNLAVLSAHRDGCATSCPGDNLYARLEQLRTDVANSCDGIKAIVTAVFPTVSSPAVYPNPSDNGAFTLDVPQPIRSLRVVDALGRVVLSKEFSSAALRFEFRLETPGFFKLITTNQQQVQWSQTVLVR